MGPFAQLVPTWSTPAYSLGSSIYRNPHNTVFSQPRGLLSLPACGSLMGDLGVPVDLTSPLRCSENPLGKVWRAWCLGTCGPGRDREPGAPSSVGHTPLSSASAG